MTEQKFDWIDDSEPGWKCHLLENDKLVIVARQRFEGDEGREYQTIVNVKRGRTPIGLSIGRKSQTITEFDTLQDAKNYGEKMYIELS